MKQRLTFALNARTCIQALLCSSAAVLLTACGGADSTGGMADRTAAAVRP